MVEPGTFDLGTTSLSMKPFVDALKWPCASYVRRRQTLLETRLASTLTVDDRHALDVALIDANSFEIGPAWSYYARVIPLCELAYWSDS